MLYFYVSFDRLVCFALGYRVCGMFYAGGDVRVHGEAGEGGVYPRTDAPLYRQEGLHPHTDH